MRKFVILLLCIFLAWGTYQTIVNGFEIGEKFSVSNYEDISNSSREIDTLISQLSNINDIEFEQRKKALESAIKKYKDTKEEYESLTESINSEDSEEVSLIDTYDVDFLWTTIGNYGTEEGITLKFDVARSMTSIRNVESYTMCDLKFTISGEYIPITDFIYDLEDDSKLGFEISEFSILKGGENLQATFTVKNVPINNRNLTDITTSINSSLVTDEYGNPVNS